MRSTQKVTLGVVALAAIATGARAQTVFSGSGADAASVTGVRDTFRTAIGGGTVPGAAGSFGGVRREINWDAVPNGFSSPSDLPANFFNVNSPRGAVFSGPGTGFRVSDKAVGGNGVALRFGEIDPSYTTEFSVFSPDKLFTSLGSNVYDINFFVAGTTTPGVTNAFGAIFTDVDTAGSTTLEYFDKFGASLGVFGVPASPDHGLSFLGVLFPTDSIGSVRVTSGDGVLGAGNLDLSSGGTDDLVVVDDFIYGEAAAAAPEPGSIALAFLGGGALAFLRRRRAA